MTTIESDAPAEQGRAGEATGRPLTKSQTTLLALWEKGSGNCIAKGVRLSRIEATAALVRRGFLRTISGLPFEGRRRLKFKLSLTESGRLALLRARAVNSHDALVTALEKIAQQTPINDQAEWMRDVARLALSLAREPHD